MHPKVAFVVAGLVVVASLGWVWYQRTYQPVVTESLKQEFTWSFVDRGVDAETSMPKTDVALRIRGIDVPLGTFDGNCFAIAGSQWPFLANEVSGAICYFAGGGTEVGVFEEGGTLVLKQGDVEEGDAEHPGFRGNFKPLTKQPNL